MNAAAVAVLLALRARDEVVLQDRCRAAFGAGPGGAAYSAWLRATTPGRRPGGPIYEAGANRLTSGELVAMALALGAWAPQPVACGATGAGGHVCLLPPWHESNEHENDNGDRWSDDAAAGKGDAP